MPRFLLLTRGGQMPDSPEEASTMMQAWADWFAAISAATVDQGSPVSSVRSVAADGQVGDAAAPAITGYTVVQAADMDAAVALAVQAPLSSGMTIEVAAAIR